MMDTEEGRKKEEGRKLGCTSHKVRSLW